MATWDVYPGDSIQKIVNKANNGDEIIVHDKGSPVVYEETILVLGKSLNISADGDVTIKAEPYNQSIEIYRGSGSIIKGFKLDGPNDGILLMKSDGCKIIENTFTDDNFFGLVVSYCKEALVSNNSFNSITGLFVRNSEDCKITNNQFKQNYSGYGIRTYASNKITISENQLEETEGFYIEHSNFCEIMKNELYNNDNSGIHLKKSSNCNIIENKIENAKDFGIDCVSSNYLLVAENFITNVNHAINIYNSEKYKIKNNNIKNNNITGIVVNKSQSLIIHKNDISFNKGGMDIIDSNETEIYENNIYSNDYGIYINDSFANINFNRLLNSGLEVSLDINSSQGVVNVDNNWWGSNLDPAKKIAGNLQYSTWLTLSLIIKNIRRTYLTDTFTVDLQSSRDPMENIFDLNFNSAGITSTQYLPDGIMMEFENYPTKLLPKIQLYTKKGQIPIKVGKKNPGNKESYKAKLDHQTIKGQII